MTIEEVYAALQAVIEGTTVVRAAGNYTLSSKAVVIPFSSLNGPEEQWGGQLRSAADGNRVHAWMFTQVDSELPGARDRAIQLYAEWVIQVRCWLGKRQGTISDNSDRDFNSEVNAVELALNAPPSTMATVLRHMRPFTMARNARLVGQEEAHVAVGNLFVRSC